MAEEFRAEELIFLIKKVNLQLTAQLEQRLRGEDVSGVQYYLLVYILRHHGQGTYLTELGREIGVSKPTLSVLMKKLREKGYLCFQENPGDIRKKKVLPTPKLMARKGEFLQKASQMEAEICGVLDPGEKDQLWKLEQKLLKAFTELEQPQNRQEEFQREKDFAAAQTV